MLTQLLRTSWCLFWPRFCKINFYKNFENFNVAFEATEKKGYEIPG